MSEEINNIEIPSPNWLSPTSVLKWAGAEIETTWCSMNRGQRPKSDVRLRALSTALDSWAKMFRLVSDTAVLSELQKQLDELRTAVEEQQKSGPTGVVRGGR